MIVVGLVWTFQGLGYWEGSAMTGQDVWAVIGPAVAGLGVALLIVVSPPSLLAEVAVDQRRSSCETCWRWVSTSSTDVTGLAALLVRQARV